MKYIIFLFLFLCNYTFCQTINVDSLKNKDDGYIYDLFYKNLDSGNVELIKAIANFYVKKEEEKKPIDYDLLLDGYILKLEADFENRNLYLDTILDISKNLKDNKYYPVNGYYMVGVRLFREKKYIESLDNLIISYDLSKQNKNKYIESQSLTTIGIIKLERIHDEEEAIKIFLQCDKYYDPAWKDRFKEDYSALNYNLAEAYRKTSNLDSAKYYTDRGYEYSLRNNLNDQKDYFIYERGIIDFLENDFTSSIKNLQTSYKTIEKTKDWANLIIANFYLGKNYLALGDEYKGSYHLKVVDSLHEITNMFIPQVRAHYIELRNKYKKNKDQLKELEYLNKVLKTDSIYMIEFKEINERFNRNFDHVDLVNDKRVLASTIVKQNRNNSLITLIFTIISTILISIALYFYLRSLKQKKQFKIIIDDYKKGKIKKPSKISNVISDEKEEIILSSLNKFEETNGFLKKNILIKDFARETLKSNDKYLRSVLRKHKGKQFPQYLNDLRIEFCISKLNDDKEFRKYTMEALSSECGFNNNTSFYSAFEKYTGLTPYFFINQLNKSKDS